MIWPMVGMKRRTSENAAQRRLRLLSVANAFARQEQSEMTFVKRENWTEDQINELPSGEHDYFDRKSGNLFDAAADRNNLFDTLAKAASAFVNSGEGT
jgi:hypothetical protein